MSPTVVWVEVTNTLSVPYTTGLQRVTRELLACLPGPDTTDGPLRFVPVRWCPAHLTYRRLTGAEAAILAEAPPRPPADGSRRRIDQLPRPVAAGARRLARVPGVAPLRRAVGLGPQLPPAHPTLEIGPWPRGSIFFDLEAAWHDPRARADLLPELIDAGVIPATLVADVLPETHPEWFQSGPAGLFRSFLRAHLRHSERFVCISKATAADLKALAKDVGETRRLRTSTITLGADFAPSGPKVAPPTELHGVRYLLDVATLEPRKNHAVLIDAFDSLQRSYPDLALVLVGKEGWKVDGLVSRIRSHPLAGTRLFWYDSVEDDLLDTLYDGAFLAVTPSFEEGFGAPVIEALAHGVPTIASNAGALTEAGGDLAEYFDPHDSADLARVIERHFFDAGWHRQRRDRLAHYEAPTWQTCAAQVIDVLAPLARTKRT
jgi:glycosyltransferase involved in cell wall biosynthesis